MLIKKLDGRDIDKIYSLGKKQFGKEFWFTRKYIAETLENFGYYFGAYEKDDLIGVILVKKFDRPKLWIFFLLVDKKWRNRGIANRLLNRIIKSAPKTYSLLFTDFEKKDKEALAFYKKHGFKKQAAIRDWYGKNSAGLIYVKDLSK